ncbi:nicotinate (nicotinamide) nucleotide adenylyltransferase [Alloacidobacterium dinghuense]|uniref:Probable nicotinate-nucleotide adenylyltransferase n=1 Tax=Alloacidobacterium dinghuense TaxID=2763107 RepID=A0A7G8BG50_9BACT|nr:nicotinate (nicotinamide) nucleotide adenylyltransferase [Alloacidobacterium dinghuense]QNI31520.1 nicotinate (nicotinamide) nucleotide adenylyltransferase [Alloacidobacterium dinghuense]
MRIAFFGGTFDPPHRGHLAIAKAAADGLRLDLVLFAPVGNQPLKHDSSAASFEDRLEMVRLAIAGDLRFQLSTIDAPRRDDCPNYTVDTIGLLRASLEPEDHLFCLVGADSFLSLPRWYHAAELLVACDFIIAGRPGFDFENAGKALPRGVRLCGDPLHEVGLTVLHVAGEADRTSTLYFLPDLREEISATELRAALADHLVDDSELPQPVADYIRAHQLYR